MNAARGRCFCHRAQSGCFVFGSLADSAEQDYISLDYASFVTVKNNNASRIGMSTDTSVVVESNEVDGNLLDDGAHPWTTGGKLFVKYSQNDTVDSNRAGFLGVYSDANSVFEKNVGSSDYFSSDSSAVVESNEGAWACAQCALKIRPLMLRYRPTARSRLLHPH